MSNRQITRHHLIPKERKKNGTHDVNHTGLHFDSVLKLWRDKHDAWHFLFKNMTLPEIIMLLSRIEKIKEKAIGTKKGKRRAA